MVQAKADLDGIKIEPDQLPECIIKEENQNNESVFCDIKTEELKLEPIQVYVSNENITHVEIDAKTSDIGQEIYSQKVYIKEDPLKIAVNEAKNRTFSCDVCDYVAKQKSVLLEHKATQHEGIKHPCDQCEYAANSKTNLAKHKAAQHEGIRYPCDKCEYAATNIGRGIYYAFRSIPPTV